MNKMDYPKIIQGGMGVAISTWQLAKAVALQGQLGIVSGTGIGIVLIARLMNGDKDGAMRRALSHFPFPEVADRILEMYFVEGGISLDTPYKRPPMWTVEPNLELEHLTVAANFVEVWLAKEGHNNLIGINLLEKVQMPNLASLYGAMLADVDYVIMGAGIPIQVPGTLDKFVTHQPVQYRLGVVNNSDNPDVFISFDPQTRFSGMTKKVGNLKRPIFLPIVSSVVLAKGLLKRSNGEVDGFIIEMPSAGGHNAPPRGQMKLNEDGEPIYGDKDKIDLEKFAALGLPFWLAGGYGNREMLQKALAAGAKGIQVGTAFAFCDESGIDVDIRYKILNQARDESIVIRTDPLVSPTGFPFKVVNLEHTASESDIYEERKRICDIGYLRQIYRAEDNNLLYRCPAEPIKAYLQKNGALEDTAGRKCLCNHLGAAAGYPQQHRSGYVEPAIITSGDDIVNITQFLPSNAAKSYSASDVIANLLAQ